MMQNTYTGSSFPLHSIHKRPRNRMASMSDDGGGGGGGGFRSRRRQLRTTTATASAVASQPLFSSSYLRWCRPIFFVMLLLHLYMPNFQVAAEGSATLESLATSSGPTTFTTSKLLELRRGGTANSGFFSWLPGGRGRGAKYQTILEDQILCLERQLRETTEKKIAIKKRLREASSSSTREELPPTQLSPQLPPEKFEDLSESLQQLESEMKTLQRIKQDLEQRLQAYTAKMETLINECGERQSSRAELEASYRKQVADLETERSKPILALLNDDNDDAQHAWLMQRIETATARATVEFWKEADKKLRQLEQRLMAVHRQELEAKRRQTQAAVDMQRQKMRTLAKAMAIRERKVYELEREQQQQKLKRAGDDAEHRREQKENARIQQESMESARLLEEELQRKESLKSEQSNKRMQKEKEVKSKREQKTIKQSDTASGKLAPLSDSLSKIFTGLQKEASTDSARKAATTDPSTSIENWQRRVPWQPISLPPTEVVQIRTPSSTTTTASTKP